MAVGVVSALGYPAMRLPWLLGIPVGVDAESWRVLQATPGMTATGVALGTAGLVGAALMLGLVRNWGVRFRRWTPPLAGRRVPVSLAVVPAAVVAVGFVAFGRGFVTGMVTGVLTTPAGTDALHLAALAALLPWGLALAVATAAYGLRRRGECGTCGLGLPEELPRPHHRAAPPERSLAAASPR